MSFYYFDTNALVKLMIGEKGHAETIEIYNQKDTMIIISNLSITEVYAALKQKKSRKEINERIYDDAISSFNNVILKSPKIAIVEINSEHYKNAKSLIINHNGLRTLDALHLAIALEYADLPIVFISSDKKLTKIAEKEGLKVSNFEICKCPECGSEIKQVNKTTICPECGHKTTTVTMQCTGADCDYVCNECSVEFCQKYNQVVV